MSSESKKYAPPRWARDLSRFLPIKSQFVLTGNIRDQFPLEVVPGRIQLTGLVPYVASLLCGAGYKHFLRFDPARGFSLPFVMGVDRKAEANFFKQFELTFDERGFATASPEKMFDQLERLVSFGGDPLAIVIDFSSRLLLRPDHLNECENRNFTRALLLSHEVAPRPIGENGTPFFNTVLWLAEKEGDLPDWLVVGNPKLRQITVPKPDHVIRRQIASSLIKAIPGEQSDEEDSKSLNQFVEGTEGLLATDLAAIVQLCQTEKLNRSQLDEAVRRFKLGVTEDPWRMIDRLKLVGAESFIHSRVRGQHPAVVRMLDIIKRAVSGLSDRRPGGGRPRGVAFLAGPTGVGKTELAKTITSLLFGDETAYIRFDMSEFSAEHSDQRLIGAPPGYVGYDVGGELTNAIREKPFSVVLFDEIEKAHPRILDKFLQVLDDGVLTSGRGERVYFSETFIIFTSNLGIYRTTPDGERVLNVSPSDNYEDVASKVREEIEKHFKVTLGRPEILNRIGENLIVFDFIRKDIGEEILDAMLAKIVVQVETTNGIRLQLSKQARQRLSEICLTDLSNGGRGIRNQLETHFINPTARVLFEQQLPPGLIIEVQDLKKDKTTDLLWTPLKPA
jgi:hypothetical protein